MVIHLLLWCISNDSEVCPGPWYHFSFCWVHSLCVGRVLTHLSIHSLCVGIFPALFEDLSKNVLHLATKHAYVSTSCSPQYVRAIYTDRVDCTRLQNDSSLWWVVWWKLACVLIAFSNIITFWGSTLTSSNGIVTPLTKLTVYSILLSQVEKPRCYTFRAGLGLSANTISFREKPSVSPI